jgi:hypothetical protein
MIFATHLLCGLISVFRNATNQFIFRPVRILLAWFVENFIIALAPVAKYTHWKQTVFYLDDVLGITEGDEISGIIEGGPNTRNPRDWDIAIRTDFDGQVPRQNAFNDPKIIKSDFLVRECSQASRVYSSMIDAVFWR